jgi:endogenous inhibitor of DNA gyrase (YacG/DUF329 family)
MALPPGAQHEAPEEEPLAGGRKVVIDLEEWLEEEARAPAKGEEPEGGEEWTWL